MAQGCGGTLVGDKYVITAAHCTDGQSASDLFVRVGDTSLDTTFEATAMTIAVSAIKQHPQYDSSTTANDIAVLELASTVSLTDYPNIKPACLPSAGAKFPGDSLVSGWGTIGSGSYLNSWLHEVNVTTFADGNCGAMNSHMTDDMLCAGLMQGGKDACQGDSGGPLVAADPAQNNAQTLIGVVSWGFGCAGQDALGIYSEVSHFTNWLNQQMPDLNTCPANGVTTTTAGPTTSTTASTVPSTTTAEASEYTFPICTLPIDSRSESTQHYFVILVCEEDFLPFMVVYRSFKRSRNWSDCRDTCNAEDECQYFKWKVMRFLSIHVQHDCTSSII